MSVLKKKKNTQKHTKIQFYCIHVWKLSFLFVGKGHSCASQSTVLGGLFSTAGFFCLFWGLVLFLIIGKQIYAYTHIQILTKMITKNL